MDNPRKTNENLGWMLCFHRRYKLGDDIGLRSDSFDGWDDVDRYLIDVLEAVIVLPLYLYDHGGLRIKVGSFAGLLPGGHAEFDSGRVGSIFAKRGEVMLEYQKKRITKSILAKVEKVLRAEVEAYDNYLVMGEDA
jgi:hypothetical protein